MRPAPDKSLKEAPRKLAVKVMGVVTLAGGLLAITTALLPPPAEGSEALILVTGGISVAIGLALLIAKPGIPDLALGAFTVLGTALITIATHEGGVAGGTADNEILYLWVVLYSFYFFSLRMAIFQWAVVGGAYAWLLASQGIATANQATTEWLVTMTTLAVAGVLVSRLRASLYRVLGETRERARTDGLTGLLNRLALDDRVIEERSRANRNGLPVSVLAVDVDGLKAVNDSLGHSRGDDVLRSVATSLQRRTRRHDAVARIGGDEFAVLLSDASETAAEIVAEDIRGSVAADPDLQEAGVTVSIGVATGRHPVPAFDDLLRAADGAMYRGKREGGDRVRSSDHPMGLPAAHAR